MSISSESMFRLAMIAIVVLSMMTAGYYRFRSTARGEKVSRSGEGLALFLAIRLSGVALLVSTLAYLIYPPLISWAEMALPHMIRWIGAVTGLLGVLMIRWTLQTLGDNLTDTVAVRKQHTLVTGGPYRFVRHPYYLAMFILVISVSLLASNWLLALCGLSVFGLLVVRIPREEHYLLKRFGDAYREYQRRTGRLIPRALQVSELMKTPPKRPSNGD